MNNAGVALGTSPAQDNVLDDIKTMLQVNVTAVMAFVSVFAPSMVKRNHGYVDTRE